jgi:hypothetical protein
VCVCVCVCACFFVRRVFLADVQADFLALPPRSAEHLDRSVKEPLGAETESAVLAGERKTDLDDWETDEGDEDSDEDDVLLTKEASSATSNSPAAPSRLGGFFTYLRNLAGNRPLEAADVEPVLSSLKQHLISKVWKRPP